jgi:hypothetical protein
MKSMPQIFTPAEIIHQQEHDFEPPVVRTIESWFAALRNQKATADQIGCIEIFDMFPNGLSDVQREAIARLRANGWSVRAELCPDINAWRPPHTKLVFSDGGSTGSS